MDSWGRGKQRFFGGRSHGATSCNYIAQLVLKKEVSKQLSKKIFRQSLYNFLLQLTKAIVSTNNSREILACRRQVLSREQESTRVEQAKTIAKESALEVEEEDKILAKKVGM